MNLRHLSYIVAIADEQSISRASARLFLSRPALNHYLIGLEKELGMPLFKRIGRKLVPTYSGNVYIAAARRMLEIKKETYKHLADTSDEAEGVLGLGVTRGFGVAMLKKVFPVFHQRYPNYRLDMVEGNVRELEQAVESGRIDIAVVGCGSARTSLVHISFAQCEVVAVLPPEHPLGHLAAPKDKPYAVMDLRRLANDRFILMNNETNIRAICDYHFAKANFSPRVIMECSLSSLAYSMVRQGVGVSILMAHQIAPDDPVHCFSLRPKEMWNHSVAFRKGTLLTKAEEYFVELAKEYFSKERSYASEA